MSHELPPGFKELDLADRDLVKGFLAADPPRASELTFTNLYMWRHYYCPAWAEHAGCLLLLVFPGGKTCGLRPVGRGDKAQATERLFRTLSEMGAAPKLIRVERDFVESHLDPAKYKWELDRDQSDYVYLARELRDLPGKRFHRKKNHVNKFRKSYEFEFRMLDPELISRVRDMQNAWCNLRDCEESDSLAAEDLAISRALDHFDELGYLGGAILINHAVEAFTLGEMLNPDTAVIHVEKGNPEFNGIYAAINQLFAAQAFPGVEFINREQDLGEPGLRKAKESYNPHHLVDKFQVFPL